MLINEVRSRFIGLPSAGVANFKDTRFDLQEVDNMISGAKATALDNRLKAGKPVHSSCYMDYLPDYEKSFQNGLQCTRFKMIPYVALNSRQDGINFIGNDCNLSYRWVNDLGTFSNNQHDRLLKAGQRNIVHVLMRNGYVEAYSYINIQTVRFSLIPSNPFDIDWWNPDFDPYPCDDRLLDEMVRVIMQTDLTIITKSFYDRINNSRDESAVPIPQTMT